MANESTPAPNSSPTPVTPGSNATPAGNASSRAIDAEIKSAKEGLARADKDSMASLSETKHPTKDEPRNNLGAGVVTIVNPDGSVTNYDPDLIKFQTNWMMGFSSVVVVVVAVLLWRKIAAQAILRSMMIPIIIGTASLLVIAGFGKDQITPVVGLLGTIAGYILGQSHPAEKGKPEGEDPHK